MKVTSNMLLKTNGEKMSDIGLSMMLLKTNTLKHSLHGVDEIKWFIESERVADNDGLRDDWHEGRPNSTTPAVR